MSEFYVQTPVMQSCAEDFRSQARRLNNENYELARIRSRLHGITMVPARIRIRLLEDALRRRSAKLTRISTGLLEIRKLYMDADRHGAEFDATYSNPAFDHEGQYGGDQGSPVGHYRDLADIVRRYHPDWSDRQIRRHLSNLNSEGCGYVAMINTLFLLYKGREADFESTFGFPMYRNGELNFDALVTDFYTAEDDPNSHGTLRDSRERMFEDYCRDHHIAVDVRNVDVTAQNFAELSREGQIVVGLSPVILFDRDGNRVFNVRDAGHAMTVTGVTDDGRLIVSSWGSTYYLDRNLSNYSDHIHFQQVHYGS